MSKKRNKIVDEYAKKIEELKKENEDLRKKVEERNLLDNEIACNIAKANEKIKIDKELVPSEIYCITHVVDDKIKTKIGYSARLTARAPLRRDRWHTGNPGPEC